jgi:hypothetical protein
VFNVTGTGTNVFARIESELSVHPAASRSDAQDRDGGAHPIRVDVARRGATVRTRRIFKDSSTMWTQRTPRQTAAAALSAPLTLSSLPLKSRRVLLAGPERGRIQLLIHTDIGAGYTESRMVTLAHISLRIETDASSWPNGRRRLPHRRRAVAASSSSRLQRALYRRHVVE